MGAFKRYDGASEDNSITMPRDVLNASSEKLTIGELLGRLETFDEEGGRMYPWAKGFAMGYPLPSFQRELVWTIAQKVRFIESIWAGGDLASYLLNDTYEFVGTGSAKVFREFSETLLDGQQRLTAMEEYLRGRFAVRDAQNTPRFWSELGRVDRRHFAATTFVRSTVKSFDETLLRKAYDLRAFGGTAHKEHERASQAS